MKISIRQNITKLKDKITFSAYGFLLAATPAVAPAPAPVEKGLQKAITNVNPLGSAAGMKSDITVITANIIKGALSLIGLIFFLLMVYAGYLWMTARGESEPVDKAKSIFTQSVIGLIIVVSAYAITYFVTKRLGAA